LQERGELFRKKGNFRNIEGKSAGKRKLLQYRREVCRKEGKSAVKRKLLQYRREVCSKEETSAV